MTTQLAKDLLAMLPGSYLVGGTVRDYLLSLPHSGDIDLLVPFSQQTTAQYICEHLPGSEVLKVRGKTTRLRLNNGAVLDLTVTSDSLAKDLCSRDFTINACAMQHRAGNWQATDVAGAAEDISKQYVKPCSFLPMESFEADPVRIVRGIRFISQLRQATGKHWQFDYQTQSDLAGKYYEQAAALLRSVDSDRMRNEVLWLLKARPAHMLYQDLFEQHRVIVEAMLEQAGGQLCLKH